MTIAWSSDDKCDWPPTRASGSRPRSRTEPGADRGFADVRAQWSRFGGRPELAAELIGVSRPRRRRCDATEGNSAEPGATTAATSHGKSSGSRESRWVEGLQAPQSGRDLPERYGSAQGGARPSDRCRRLQRLADSRGQDQDHARDPDDRGGRARSPPASCGCSSDEARRRTATSDVLGRLTMMFETGSGEVLIPSRTPALTAWLASAMRAGPAGRERLVESQDVGRRRTRPRSRPPIAGRIERARPTSQALSTQGILSATNSTANITQRDGEHRRRGELLAAPPRPRRGRSRPSTSTVR